MATAAPTPATTNLYETDSCSVASAIVAAGLLKFSHCYEKRRHGTFFVFLDPEGAGPRLLREYQSGLFPLVHPKVLNEARNFLMDERRSARESHR